MSRTPESDVRAYSSQDLALNFYCIAFAIETSELGRSAPRDLSKIVGFLESKQCDDYLPRQPLVLPRLMQALRNPESEASDVVDILLEDASLTAEVLKMANSPALRNSSQPIASVSAALVIIGADGMKSLMLRAMLRPLFSLKDKVFHRFAHVLWEQAIIAAETAQMVAARRGGQVDFSAQLLALIINMAQIILLRIARQTIEDTDYDALLKLVLNHQAPVVLGLIRNWQLGDDIEAACHDYYAGHSEGLAAAISFGIGAGQASELFRYQKIDLDGLRAQLIAAAMPEKFVSDLMPMILALLGKAEIEQVF